jgi:hypothetical protein
MKFSYSLCQVLGWSVLVRVDGLTYSFLGDETLVVNGTVNLTNIVITPTQTVVAGKAGPMQVNLTFLIPIEVRFHSSVTFHCLTYASSKAQRYGQTIHPIFVYVFHREIIGRRKSCCAGVFRHQRTYVQPFLEARVCLQLRCRVELEGCKSDDSVGGDVQCRCDLPQCHTPDTGKVHRGRRPSGMGHAILCYANRE